MGGRVAAMTKIGNRRTIVVRGRGGNNKHRALKLDHGNFSWGSESQSRVHGIIDVVYNATNNELVRTKTLVKNCIVKIDASQANQAVDKKVLDQFSSGKLFACISSRPGQSGRCDGYILEGKELEFYMKKMDRKK